MPDNDNDDPKKANPPHNAATPQNERRQLEEAHRIRTAPTPPSGPWERLPTGEHPITQNEFHKELKRSFNLNDVKQVVAMIVVAVGTCFGAYKLVISDAKAQTDAGIQAVDRRVEEYKKANDATVAELKQEMKKMATKEEVHEVRGDLREFYRAWRDDKRSVRLDQPLDGGR